MAGWSNGKTLFWIAAADAKGKTHKYRKGDIGFHHYAFELSSRKDVDALGAFLVEHGMNVVDPPGEYYEPSYYAVYFTDPDGMKLEGMVFKPPPKQRRAERRPSARSVTFSAPHAEEPRDSAASRSARPASRTVAADPSRPAASPPLRMMRFRACAIAARASNRWPSSRFTMSNSAVFFVPAARSCARVRLSASRRLRRGFGGRARS